MGLSGSRASTVDTATLSICWLQRPGFLPGHLSVSQGFLQDLIGHIPSHVPGGGIWTTIALPGGTSGKESACHCRRYKRRRFDRWVGKIPPEEDMATHIESVLVSFFHKWLTSLSSTTC